MLDHPVNDCHLLVVDDEEVNLALLRTMLTRAGFSNVCTISDPVLVRERIASFEPDLILLDLHMPRIDGYEILRQIRDEQDEDLFLPIVVLTADATDDATRRALALGANDYITKPFQLTELLLRVHNLLEARMTHERSRRLNRSLQSQLDRPPEDRPDGGPSPAVLRLLRIINGDGDGLVSVFQPIVDIQSGRIVGAEALPRFTCAPIRPPEGWIRDAEDACLAEQLEIRMVQAAVAHALSLPAGVFLSVNVSPGLAASPLLASAVSDAPPDRLVIEVSEQAALDDAPALREILAPLRASGMRLAIDDAGAGHAGIQRLLELRPDILKLDRTIVHDIDLDAARRALVSSLVAYGAEVGCRVLADGFERREELEVLAELGVSLGQSNYLARPAPLPFPTELVPTELRPDLAVLTEAF